MYIHKLSAIELKVDVTRAYNRGGIKKGFSEEATARLYF